MNTVEFRAWEKEEKKMYHDVGLVGTLIILEHEQSGYDFCEVELTLYDHLDDKYDLMQHTGIKDKNSKKIFRGDILKGPTLYETPENTATTYSHWEVTYENCSFHLGGSSMEEDIDWISEECEVVGNVYENPELLQNLIK